jgi:hypothetical protein
VEIRRRGRGLQQDERDGEQRKPGASGAHGDTLLC